MREMIGSAAQRGELSELLLPIEWNELPPDFGPGDKSDPISVLKAQSADGTGYDVLADLLTVLSMSHTVVPLGPDPENPNIFVFPYLATRDLSQLTPAETVDVYRLFPPEEAAGVIASKEYTGWILTIGADGTWHSFRRQTTTGQSVKPVK